MFKLACVLLVGLIAYAITESILTALVVACVFVIVAGVLLALFLAWVDRNFVNVGGKLLYLGDRRRRRKPRPPRNERRIGGAR